MSDTPDRLPDHPEERKLRRHEQELATTLRKLTKKVAQALERHDRHGAFAGLAVLEETARAAKQGMARALQDQMDVAAGKPYEPQGEGDADG